MRRRFISLAPQEPLAEAERLMRMARVRFLPVSDRGVLVGGLSHRALLGFTLTRESPDPLGGRLGQITVDRVMDPSPARATPEMRLDEAASLLVGIDCGCLPVVEPSAGEPRLVGVVTESDLLRAAYGPRPR